MLNFFEVHEMKEQLGDVEAYLEHTEGHLPSPTRERALNILRAGGKRVRPAFAIMTASIVGKEKEIIPYKALKRIIRNCPNGLPFALKIKEVTPIRDAANVQ